MLNERGAAWTLETFPFDKQPSAPAATIRQLGELDFIAQKRNVVFIGPTGVGKTGLATAITLNALRSGNRCRFVKAQDLFDELLASAAGRSSRRVLDHLARMDLLLPSPFSPDSPRASGMRSPPTSAHRTSRRAPRPD